MAGQSKWGNPGDSTNAYVVRPGLEKQVYYETTWRTFWGKTNEGRSVTTEVLERGGTKLIADKGNSSIVWEKDRGTGTNEVRFTLRERKTGMATYGEAPVKPGAFSNYKHSNVQVIQVDSPAYPIVGAESEMQISEVIDDVVALEKDDITLWGAQEMDMDGWRGYFLGASRGLLSSEDGAMNIALAGGTAGEYRAPYNNYTNVAGTITPSATLATHNASLATALDNLGDKADEAFTYETHRVASHLIEDFGLRPTSIGKREYRAICAIDRALLDRMTSGDAASYAATSRLYTLMKDAMERSRTNPALYHMDALVLDDILYIPVRQLEFFRPSVSGSDVVFGAGMTSDPRSANFANTSKICGATYMGAGAMLRGVRRKMWWTDEEGLHGKGKEYGVHYYDGWKRNDWVSQDGRSAMSNDSSFTIWAYDPGFGKGFAAAT